MTTEAHSGTPVLPAGIGVSHVRVYTSAAPDGLCGGTPHLHVTCTEMYVGLRGTGQAHFLTPDGPAVVDLAPGVAVQFTPGTIHRLVNGPDPLEILVIMENGRLNEGGDVVFCFPERDLADPDAYARWADIGDPDHPDAEAIARRRDRAVEGLTHLMSAWHADPRAGRDALLNVYEHAVRIVGARARAWPGMIEAGPARIVQALERRTDAVLAADTSHLRASRIQVLPALQRGNLTPRMCGDLWSYNKPP